MPEAVRLVIWDLDGTFWRGTLSEGGMAFVEAHKHIVIELAKRGIVSSICSKNDFDRVKAVLSEEGIWDYFVLPSISWDAKGPRIQALIDKMGLRPATVLFMDDNPLNLAEVRRFVPDIQTQSDAFISHLLDHALFRGKDDHSLSRLKQYKALEQRKIDEAASASDVETFLRDSEIKVRLEFDVMAHVDRAIELINRTNQLNFTKVRLPEDTSLARAEVVAMLASFRIQAALVHVSDRYGDHGFCGVYIHNSATRSLSHFCFSCRILGMGVERWLYAKLGKPGIAIEGEVLVDLLDEAQPTPDWIEQTFSAVDPAFPANPAFDRVVARGSCDLGAVVHYFRSTSSNVYGEYPFFRDDRHYQIDHSCMVRQASAPLSPAQLAVANRLGFVEADFHSEIYAERGDEPIIILGFGNDPGIAVYRHRETGVELPIVPPRWYRGILWKGGDDIRQIAPLDPLPMNKQWAEQIEFAKQEFDYLGLVDEERFKENINHILSRLPGAATVIVIERSEKWREPTGTPIKRHVAINRWTQDVCRNFPNVTLLQPDRFVERQDEILDSVHLSREVYFRMFRGICEFVERRNTGANTEFDNGMRNLFEFAGDLKRLREVEDERDEAKEKCFFLQEEIKKYRSLVRPTVPPDFDPEVYKGLHVDLQERNVNGLQHWLEYGYFEGRRYR